MSNDNTTVPPPPPPPPPYGNGGEPKFQDPFASSADTIQLDQGKPAVAASPGRVFVVLGGVLVVLVIIVLNLFVFEDKPEPVVDARPVTISKEQFTPEISDLDKELAEPLAPPPLPLPPPIPEPQLPDLDPAADGPTNELLQRRLRSPMVVSGGGGGGGLFSPDAGVEATEDDPNLQFANRVYKANSRANRAEATHIGNLNTIVAQGRIIQASLETVINTELPGSIRAIVSRDVYAEAGDVVMIPKGSRLIGQYNSSLFSGQSRVYVVWTRVIRPDGVDVAINSPLIDQIGQAGVAGHVDTKFGQIFSRAILTSMISIAVAAVVDEAFDGGDLQQTTNTDGSTTTNGDLTSEASLEAVNQFGDIMSSYLRRFIDVQPTIMVDQGTNVNVFVNRDLVFPPDLVGARFIP